MRTLTLAAVVLTTIATTPAMADRPGRGWISQARVTHMLAKRGYKVTKIEADDGHWEGEARRCAGRRGIRNWPGRGAITKLERDR
jgi:hypothetical protein